MVMLTRPLYSETASGKFANAYGYRNTRKGQVAAALPTGNNPRTPAQLKQRQRFSIARLLAGNSLLANPTLYPPRETLKEHLATKSVEGSTMYDYLARAVMGIPINDRPALAELYATFNLDPATAYVGRTNGDAPDYILRSIKQPAPGLALTVWAGFIMALILDGYLSAAPFQEDGFKFPGLELISPLNCLTDEEGNRLVYGMDMALLWEDSTDA